MDDVRQFSAAAHLEPPVSIHSSPQKPPPPGLRVTNKCTRLWDGGGPPGGRPAQACEPGPIIITSMKVQVQVQVRVHFKVPKCARRLNLLRFPCASTSTSKCLHLHPRPLVWHSSSTRCLPALLDGFH